ncbi:MAG: M14-type cytosolic carboxypeptidase [Paraglaciecola sp.]|uniref:M14 family metallopeptidase n=1 Tax=Paraglaciecola sp. TaxID=1920173 RepID=UPI00273EC6A5|nr:M14-type cytosolic carboxypeptidase [Paraglaciecola sp.]MDP5031801.1 M14-type cytosolic carboxypeptidase [Paraglaciecola sp.]MDP5129860.1 M14-type cytosolic carboxypeptidase [Paraglaciecola sp.]
MRISSNFDSGNIEVNNASSPNDIRLSIKKDKQSDFFQWFHFKLETTAFLSHKLVITNLHQSAYPDGWKNYQAVASYDRQEWFRVDTEFDGDSLVIQHTPEYEHVYYAYFAPYSYERHLDLLAWAQQSPVCQQQFLGETLDGRDMSMLVVGEPEEGKKVIWVTARQHPGETMAEWFVEGFLERLLDESDGVARQLLEKAVFYVIPNMNPDGSVRGHLRTNAIGVNLNREWATPSLASSPEVYFVKQKMIETGVDMFLDVHGDEALPYNFVAGCEGNPGYSPRIKNLEDKFKQNFMLATPDFQDSFGYPKDKPGEANPTVATHAIGQHFDCLAFTLEMPFKDNIDLPDSAYGWSPARSKQLGEDVMIAMRAVVDMLR